MKASLTDLVKSWQKNAEEFRGQSPHSPQSTLLCSHQSLLTEPRYGQGGISSRVGYAFFPSYNQFCFLFLDTNGIICAKNHYAHQGSFNDFLGNVRSQLVGRRNNMMPQLRGV